MNNNPFSKFMKKPNNKNKKISNINEVVIDDNEDFDFSFEEKAINLNNKKKEVNLRNKNKLHDANKVTRTKNNFDKNTSSKQNVATKVRNTNTKSNLKNNIKNNFDLRNKVDNENKIFINKEIIDSLNTFNRKPPCRYYKECGGCNLQELTYEGQLKYKEKIVGDIFKDHKDKINPIIGASEEFHYRNKIISTFTFIRNEIKAGIYSMGTHKIIPINKCIIEDNKGYEIVNDIKNMMPGFKMMPYDEDSKFGFLRHVLIRRGRKTGEVLLCLVVSDKIFKGKNNFIKAIRDLHPEISTIVLNINDKSTSAVLGNANITIFGKGTIKDILMDNTFEISASSFYQVNSDQTEKLYKRAIELANLNKDEVLLDAYSGIGTISIIASYHVKEVISVELNKEAHINSIKNAHLNSIKNVKFINMDATKYIEEAASRHEKIDVVIMDPPRSGSTKEFMKSIERLKPSKLVYISCNPYTQIRDLKELKGYKIESITPVDLFPQTIHVECIVMMSKIAPNK